MKRTAYCLSAALVLSLAAREGFAQSKAKKPAPAAPAAAPEKEEPKDPLGRETPHGAVVGFLKAAGRSDFAEAAQYLDSRTTPQKAEELAKQLKVVLDRSFHVNIETLSHAIEGDVKDNARKNRDRIGAVETPSGSLDILLDRVVYTNKPSVWLFSSETLREIPKAYGALQESPIERLVPERLKEIKFFSVPLWRWLVGISFVALAVVAAWLAARLAKWLLRFGLKRVWGDAVDRRASAVTRPIFLLVLALSAVYASRWAAGLLFRSLWAGLSVVLAVMCASSFLIGGSDIISDVRSRQLARRQANDQIAVLVLARRVFKILVVFAAIVFLLHRGGVDVNAMLAGLGIGGIALALGAQKTLEDLLGGITVISRRAVRVGDFCQIAGATGTVEDIGLNSTRIRTLDRTVISISNAKVSQMNLENYSLKDKVWFHHVFGLRYDTPPRAMRSILEEVNRALKQHPKVETESARVRLVEFGVSSLDLEVSAYILATDASVFLAVQEELMLQIMEIVDANGTSLALRAQIPALQKAN
jgi:MscS family membrane protein